MTNNPLEKTVFLADEQATSDFAGKMSEQIEKFWGKAENQNESPLLMIYLQGDLGAGKSFFSRALIQAFLPEQKVKSPTYTLVESYEYLNKTIHHFDLYRLCDPEELEYLAVRDILHHDSMALVEWPQKGRGVLPDADIELRLEPLEQGRWLKITAFSEVGKSLLEALSSF